MSEHEPPLPDTYSLRCPYCGKTFTESLKETYNEVTCPECKGRKWHRGEFIALLAKVENAEQRGLYEGEVGPKIWNLKLMTGEEEITVNFATFVDLQVSPGDTITLSHKKKSKGIIMKNWSGEHEGRPSVLYNNTLNRGWVL